MAETGDLILNMTPSPDGKVLVAMNSGYQPHALTVIDVKTRKVIQTIPVLSAWLGFAWAPDGSTLYVSGGNATGDKQQNRPTMAPIAGPDDPPAAKDPTIAPVYAIPYRNGRLIDTEARVFNSPLSGPQTYWSGLARHPTKSLLYAAMRGVDSRLSTVVVFDATTRALVKQIPVGVSPYDVLLNKDGSRLYVSNWSSGNVSIIDTATDKVIGTVAVGDNPNDMILSEDGRLFVACANDNSVAVIDVKAMRVIETINTSLTPLAPVGSTPNALAIDPKQKLLFVANADNNNVAVVDIADRKQSDVAGFIPTGWYPSALALAEKGGALYVGSSKGQAAYADLYGPNSPLRSAEHPGVSIKTLQKASVERIPYAPEHMADVAVDIAILEGVDVEIGVNYLAAQFANASNTRIASADGLSGLIPERTLWRASLNVQLPSGNSHLFATVENLTDETYISSRVDGLFAGTPRMASAGIIASF